MSFNFRLFSVCAVLVFAFAPWARAEDEVQLVKPTYAESFVSNAKVSGNLLVGVKWAGASGAFDPKKVGIRIPAAAKGHKACVEISSQDGRYTAENLYQIGMDAAAVSRFQTKTAFLEPLTKYDSAAMAVTVRLTENCDDPDVGTIVPAVYKPEEASQAAGRQLIAYVNAEPQKVAVRLTSQGKEIGTPASCAPAGTSVKVAFSSACTIGLGADVAAGAYDLEVTVRERFEKSVKHFPLLID